ncbi:MAG: hypothetical protein QM764_10980 [Chitinophagaceae bacterium]
MDTGTIINGTIFFEEIQRFRVKWLWILLIVVISFSVFLPIVISAATGENWKEAVLSLLITLPIESIVIYVFYVVKLETVVNREGIYYRWQPFFRRYNFIARADIETVIADNGPVLSYGFHYVLGYGWVYNTGPGKGIRFNLIGGKKIFIGTKNIIAFQAAVDRMINDKM